MGFGAFSQQVLRNWQKLGFAGALGDWTFFVLDPAPLSESQRLARVKHLED
jgi:hypothetical protein